MSSLARHLDPVGTVYLKVCRPPEAMTGDQIVALHKAGKPVPHVEYVVVIMPMK